ncbi:hypothetical protein DFS34DRAFT_419037 [Phlyctochytrium arcticum]|nr:hypothetical protein DFS34DRAFT_419037 [Phlyctochytrium arcticum]
MLYLPGFLLYCLPCILYLSCLMFACFVSYAAFPAWRCPAPFKFFCSSPFMSCFAFGLLTVLPLCTFLLLCLASNLPPLSYPFKFSHLRHDIR